jgi:hypothetical protein
MHDDAMPVVFAALFCAADQQAGSALQNAAVSDRAA